MYLIHFLLFLFVIPVINLPFGYITLPSGDKIKTYIAKENEAQEKGFSGVKLSEIAIDTGLLFYFSAEGLRQFWMPDTYFNLDIFYLDQNLKVLKIDKNFPHHPGRQGQIPIASPFKCWHVLEMPTQSSKAKKIRVGDKLLWSGQF